MRGWVVSLAAVALAFAGAAEAAPSEARRPDVSLPLEGAIANPDWIRRPTGEEMANNYPRVAQLLGLDGRAVIVCEVTLQGTTTNCVVKSETPVGMGFGEAAISLSDFFRMKPMTVDGAPVAGGRVTVPMGFMVPRPEDTAAAAAGSQPAPSPKALELARRIVGVSYSADTIRMYVAQTRTAIGQQFANMSLTEQEQAAIDEYVTAVAGAMPVVAEIRAQRLASSLSEADLAAVDNFVESSAGRAYAAAEVSQSSHSPEDMGRIWASVRKEASRTYCLKYACGSAAPSAPAPAPKP
jgi:TonB family protein